MCFVGDRQQRGSAQAEAVTGDSYRQTQTLASSRAQYVESHERDIHQSSTGRSVGIQDEIASLYSISTGSEEPNRLDQEIWIDHAVGVDHEDGIKGFAEENFEGELQRESLTPARRIRADQNAGASGAREIRGGIGAIVGNHHDLGFERVGRDAG